MRNFKSTVIRDFGPLYTLEDVVMREVIDPQEKPLNSENNLMLYHGTNRENCVGILKKGFANSTKGVFGEGVYLTECSDAAISFSAFHQSQRAVVVVCEVLGSRQMREVKFQNYRKLQPHGGAIEHPFTKHAHKKSRLSKECRGDWRGRAWRVNEVSKWSQCDEYVADHERVRPRYVIETRVKVNPLQYRANERFLSNMWGWVFGSFVV